MPHLRINNINVIIVDYHSSDYVLVSYVNYKRLLKDVLNCFSTLPCIEF